MGLRPYQQAAIDAIHSGFERNNSILAELPTGCGKTHIFCDVAATWNDGRVMIVAPQINLVEQAAEKIHKRTGVKPDIDQGKKHSYKGNNESFISKYIVASKDSIIPRKGKAGRGQLIKNIGLLIFDEAHLAINGIRQIVDMYPDAKVLGVTATPLRHDKIGLHNIFNECVFQYAILDAINDGWLVCPRAKCVKVLSMNLSKVRSKINADGEKEFIASDLAKAMEDEQTVLEVAEIVSREWNGEKTVVYCESIDQSKKISDRLNDAYGISAGWICSDTSRCPELQHKRMVRGFTNPTPGDKEIGILCNVDMLSTGWDFPGLKHIVMAKPTRSLSKYIQRLGRGTRPLEGVVDFEGSTAASRKAAIAASGKPFYRVTDLVDAAMEHKIVTTLDALAGKVLPEIIQRAKEESEKDSKSQDPFELMTLAEKLIQQEKIIIEQDARLEKWRKRLAQIKVDIELAFSTPNVFAGGSALPGTSKPAIKAGNRVISCGKKKGQTFAQAGVRWCEWAADNHPNPGVKYGALRFLKESRNAN